ncbi:amidohydrolase family protein [Nesterenkonia alba]|uniref:amidohydrolase family protein n=1 Tax=Nesterenkonia alba TaxID=515814 RepID=UPI0003B5520D|nr:amidohydrolase family protein [Nesterenkonia alba]
MPQPQRIVDAHHHLWDIERNRYPWDFSYLAQDYTADVGAAPVVGTVHVEAAHDPHHPVAETRWLEEVAQHSGFPQAIVAYAPLESAALRQLLDDHAAASPRLRGIRQMLNWEPQDQIARRPGLLDDPAWEAGLDELARRELSFDLQVFPSQLQRAAEVVAAHPEVLFILNHGGYLQQATDERDDLWRAGLRALAASENVVVKASAYGSVEPAFSEEGLTRYVTELAEVFGVERLLWGSNVPVEKQHVSFTNQLDAFLRVTADWSVTERAAFYAENALRIYRIDEADLLAPAE